jgi:TusA-related sulfurtransferase
MLEILDKKTIINRKNKKLVGRMKKMAEKTLDCLGKKCPMPVLLTKKELKKLESGDVLELVVDDTGALKDIPALLSKTGDELLETKEEESKIVFKIKKK